MSRGPDGPNCPACAWPDDTHGACAHHEAPPPLGGTFWAEAMSLAAGQAYERGRVAGLVEAASVVRAEASRLREPHDGTQALHFARMSGANALQRVAGLIDKAASLVSATKEGER